MAEYSQYKLKLWKKPRITLYFVAFYKISFTDFN